MPMTAGHFVGVWISNNIWRTTGFGLLSVVPILADTLILAGGQNIIAYSEENALATMIYVLNAAANILILDVGFDAIIYAISVASSAYLTYRGA